MQIVIDIPENVKNTIDTLDDGFDAIKEACYGSLAIKAIQNGTPLPKGHGRLIDADELYGNFIDGTEGYDCNTWSRIEIGDIIEDTPTIIGVVEDENYD